MNLSISGNLFQPFLQRFAYHAFDEGIDVGLDGQLHLAAGFRCGEQLYPQVKGHRRLYGFELDGLRFLALDDLQLNPAHRSHGDADAVGSEFQILGFVFWQTVLYLFYITQVTQLLIHALLRIRNLLDVTFKF